MSYYNTISVAMCTYNGEKFLSQQLESIATQTRLPSELVICDDRSTDTTAKIVEKFAATAPFHVSFNVNSENLGGSSKGITRNFERASRLCKGQLIAFSDQDDIWLPKRLEHMAQAMEEPPRPGGLFVDAQLIDGHNMPQNILLSETTGMTYGEQIRLRRGESLQVLLSMTKVYGCSLMVESSLLMKVLPVPPHWWFDAWIACTVACYSQLIFLPEQLFLYRIHSNQSVGAALPTVGDRIEQWKRPAKQYWEDSELQLIELHSKLAAETSTHMEEHLEYICGRMDLLRFRAELPANPLARLINVISEAKNYSRYFNGWKSVIKDITAPLGNR